MKLLGFLVKGAAGRHLQIVGEEKESPATLSDPPKTTD